MSQLTIFILSTILMVMSVQNNINILPEQIVYISWLFKFHYSFFFGEWNLNFSSVLYISQHKRDIFTIFHFLYDRVNQISLFTFHENAFWVFETLVKRWQGRFLACHLFIKLWFFHIWTIIPIISRHFLFPTPLPQLIWLPERKNPAWTSCGFMLLWSCDVVFFFWNPFISGHFWRATIILWQWHSEIITRESHPGRWREDKK